MRVLVSTALRMITVAQGDAGRLADECALGGSATGSPPAARTTPGGEGRRWETRASPAARAWDRVRTREAWCCHRRRCPGGRGARGRVGRADRGRRARGVCPHADEVVAHADVAGELRAHIACGRRVGACGRACDRRAVAPPGDTRIARLFARPGGPALAAALHLVALAQGAGNEWRGEERRGPPVPIRWIVKLPSSVTHMLPSAPAATDQVRGEPVGLR